MSLGPPVTLRLPFRAPLLPDSLFGHLAATGVPGAASLRSSFPAAGARSRTDRWASSVAHSSIRWPGPAVSTSSSPVIVGPSASSCPS